MQTLFEKLIRNFLPFECHHAILARDARKLDHAFNHRVLFLDWWEKGLRHDAKAAKEGRKWGGVHHGKEGAAEYDQDGRNINKGSDSTAGDHGAENHPDGSKEANK